MPENDKILYVVVISTLGDDQPICYTIFPKFALRVARDLSQGVGPNTRYLAEKGTPQSIKILRVKTEDETPSQIDIVYMIGMKGAGMEWEIPDDTDFFCKKFQRLCADDTQK